MEPSPACAYCGHVAPVKERLPISRRTGDALKPSRNHPGLYWCWSETLCMARIHDKAREALRAAAA